MNVLCISEHLHVHVAVLFQHFSTQPPPPPQVSKCIVSSMILDKWNLCTCPNSCEQKYKPQTSLYLSYEYNNFLCYCTIVQEKSAQVYKTFSNNSHIVLPVQNLHLVSVVLWHCHPYISLHFGKCREMYQAMLRSFGSPYSPCTIWEESQCSIQHSMPNVLRENTDLWILKI